MDGAAENGHLDVVEWLHKNRREGCTSEAFLKGAENGHLDILKWLRLHRPEQCKNAAIHQASRNGHLEVVKWLSENQEVPPGVSCANWCTRRGNPLFVSHGIAEMLRLREAQGIMGCFSLCKTFARGNGHSDLLAWLRRRNDLNKCDCGLCVKDDADWLDLIKGPGVRVPYCMYF